MARPAFGTSRFEKLAQAAGGVIPSEYDNFEAFSLKPGVVEIELPPTPPRESFYSQDSVVMQQPWAADPYQQPSLLPAEYSVAETPVDYDHSGLFHLEAGEVPALTNQCVVLSQKIDDSWAYVDADIAASSQGVESVCFPEDLKNSQQQCWNTPATLSLHVSPPIISDTSAYEGSSYSSEGGSTFGTVSSPMSSQLGSFEVSPSSCADTVLYDTAHCDTNPYPNMVPPPDGPQTPQSAARFALSMTSRTSSLCGNVDEREEVHVLAKTFRGLDLLDELATPIRRRKPPRASPKRTKLSRHVGSGGAISKVEAATFRCLYCDRGFRRSEHYKRHMKSALHSLERPFVCPVEQCQKAFDRTDNRKEHMKRHLRNTKRTAFVPGLQIY